MVRQIAVITKKVITLLSLSCPINTPIYIGPSNEAHMKSSHPRDFANYYPHIGLILSQPDYVGVNHKDASIEYVREFKANNDYVKVAVRIAANNYFARSLYVLKPNRVANFINKGTLKKFDE